VNIFQGLRGPDSKEKSSYKHDPCFCLWLAPAMQGTARKNLLRVGRALAEVNEVSGV